MTMIILSRRSIGRFVSALCLLAGGCEATTPPAPTQTAANAETPETPEDSLGGKHDVTVEVKSWAGVQKMVAAHRGQVVIVDVWSTWCVPCMREFPNLVKLHRRFSHKVACISVDIDYIGTQEEPPESFRDKVLEFLRKQEATIQNVICSDPDEDVLEALGVGSIPVVLVYDREGKLQKKFTNDENEYGKEGFTYPQHIVPLVEKLLSDAKTP